MVRAHSFSEILIIWNDEHQTGQQFNSDQAIECNQIVEIAQESKQPLKFEYNRYIRMSNLRKKRANQTGP
jgi:hypothetical protein